MKVSFKSNFSFSKLKNKLPTLISDVMKEEGDLVAKTAVKTIEEGQLPPLSTSTKQKRLAGYSDYKKLGHKPFVQTDMTPLDYTGRLKKSFNVTEKGVEMFEYGLEHNFGRGEPKREFISFPGSPKLKSKEKKIAVDFIEKMNKAMK